MQEKTNPFWLAEREQPGQDEHNLSRAWVEGDKATESLSPEEQDVAATGAAYGLLAGRIESRKEIERLQKALRDVQSRLTPNPGTLRLISQFIDSVLE